MGQQMAKDSMILDMADNIMIVSKVHESTSETLTNFGPVAAAQKSAAMNEFSFNYDKEFDPKNLKNRI